ncbi:hypothetical protein C8R44DRAFT_738428 [Mycena epipterygia]|nr:hypothetical protein C8R44DRAFT_738428 [Mycena epipterygia]
MEADVDGARTGRDETFTGNRSLARGNTRTAIKISAAVLRGRLEVVKAASATAESCVKAEGLEATTVQKAEIENAEQLESMVNGLGALGSRVIRKFEVVVGFGGVEYRGDEIQPHHFFAFFPPTSRRDGAAGAQERLNPEPTRRETARVCSYVTLHKTPFRFRPLSFPFQ